MKETVQETICVVGLGYVGLPLAHAFARNGYGVIGYDISGRRINELKAGHDRTGEVPDEELRKTAMTFTTDPSLIKDADIVILALPTPVDDANKPDLTLVEDATRVVGKNLKRGATVVYESTVYPGVTEELCGPILEEESGMRCGVDFTLGYSPERINPGDREHTVERIVKVVAGQDAATLERLADLYGSVVKAGIHRAPSIKVAEMAKAIENAQRDLNIAFINEVAILCNKIGIKTKDVLDAAASKWNFLPFKPGLVGGHCIGVDPFYLVEKARQLGMETNLITAGRSVNDGMSAYVAVQAAGALAVPKEQARVLVLGLTFKENVPDTRNSKAQDVVKQIRALGCSAEAHDPYVAEEDVRTLGMTPGSLAQGPYDAVLLLVPHQEYLTDDTEPLIAATKPGGVIYDLKSVLDGERIEKAGRKYLAL